MTSRPPAALLSVSRDEAHRFSKQPLDRIVLLAGLGENITTRGLDGGAGLADQPSSDSRLTTMASWVVREMTTTASSSADGFSSRCGTNGGT